jgi:uncharacterized protein (TIGR03032 family)
VSDFELVRLAYHEIEGSPGLVDWLGQERLSLALTNGPELFLAGVRADGSLRVTNRQYGVCTALAARTPETLFMATRFQIWRLENALPAGSKTEDGHDRLFVPRTAWTTGMVAVHDLALDPGDRPVFANGRFSCVTAVDERLNFAPLWKPPFVSTLASEDRCHLTGLAMEGGRPAYVTCAAAADTANGWRANRRDGGVVVRVADGEIVCDRLSMPHSPRLRDGQLWITNGGTGELGTVDVTSGGFQPVAALPGFTRGLTFHGRFAVVGSSRSPKDDTFEDLPLQDRLDRAGTDPVCGVFVVDCDTGRVEHSLVLHAGSPEVTGLAVLTDTRSPTAVAIQGDDVQEIVTIPCLGT